MKKIGILTFHNACNYGAVLQAYALQEFISSSNGFEGFIIDYRNKYIEQSYLPSAYIKKGGNLLKNIIQFLLCYRDLSKRNYLFSLFRQSYFKVETDNLTKDNIAEITKLYDAFIVGSDQVWNRDIIKDDNTFFLDFVDTPQKKYSYAASIGKTSFSENEVQDIIGNLESFKSISIRENDVTDFLSKKMQREIVSSVDPVFLFERAGWRKFSSYKNRKPYVLFFMMGLSSTALPALSFAKKLSDEMNLDIVYLSDKERWYKFRDLTHFGVASPQEFVGLIEHAECVVTNSFHATAFSIILHTPFFIETNILRSNRVTSLIDIAGLNKCGLKNGNADGKPLEIINSINWAIVDEKIDEQVNKSKEYLYSIFSDIK